MKIRIHSRIGSTTTRNTLSDLQHMEMFRVVIVLALYCFISTFSKDITEIDHIVVFMQENRAFDHYFGTLRGARGFNDHTPINLPSGKTVFYQSVNSSYIELPWHMDTTKTSGTCVDEAPMNYPVDIAMWNNGHFDSWNSARNPELGMSYFTRPDLDYYYELADAFTLCDQYYQSTLTRTNPNRLLLFSGSNGLSVGQTPILENEEPNPGFSWPTYAEVLEEAGISWRVYQESDNFDDNAFAWFETFKKAKPGNPLYDKGIAIVPDLVKAFENDIKSGTLAQVSWIIAPTALSEHATNRPAYGEDLTARLLLVLGANLKVYSKTVFFLNYDEQGGFFDHIPPPTPPTSVTTGKSTVTTVGEVYQGKPIGLGFRVPMTIISPWTRGGYISSEVFDHTSVIKFIEKRFGAHCPNISPWRRAVVGDLTSAFDFNNPDYTWPNLPDTSNYVKEADRECSTLPPPRVPIRQTFPVQEKGTKPSRALPYEFHADASIDPSSNILTLALTNTGTATFHVAVYDMVTTSNFPRQYTVEAGKTLSDSWKTSGKYSQFLYGPNGYLRQFSGDSSLLKPTTTPNPEIQVHYNITKSIHNNLKNATTGLTLTLKNTGAVDCTFVVTANAYRTDGPWNFKVGARSSVDYEWDVGASGNWYDFSVSIPSFDSSFVRRLMGRVENGLDSISDPAMA